MKVIDITNQKFGKLTALNREENDKHGQARWKCICDCGNIIITSSHSLRSGHTKSCGCTRNDKIKMQNYKHGMSNTRLFHIWMGLKHRCTNPNFCDAKLYSERGITICDEWKNDFTAFYDWSMLNGYNDSLSIDRIDSNGNYCPQNCRWANHYVQANNRRNSNIVTYHGNSNNLDDMCRSLNVNSKVIRSRMKRNNLSFEEAVDNYEYTSPFKEYWKKKSS